MTFHNFSGKELEVRGLSHMIFEIFFFDFLRKKKLFWGVFYALKHVFLKIGMFLICVLNLSQKFDKFTYL